MDSAKLNDWMQVLGIFALVASLIFVGLQMKQEQEIAIAAQYQDRTQATMDMYLTRLEVGAVGSPDELGFDPELGFQEVMLLNWMLTAFDNHHYQYTSGFLDEDAWRGFERAFGPAFKNCRPRSVYEVGKQRFRKQFVEYIEATFGQCQDVPAR